MFTSRRQPPNLVNISIPRDVRCSEKIANFQRQYAAMGASDMIRRREHACDVDEQRAWT
jgi:hypothetical protein